MRRDVEVAEFTFDSADRQVTGKTHVLSRMDLPLGCLDNAGRFSSSRLSSWIELRAIPPTRQGIEPVLRHLNLMTPAELLDSGLALSLSDQYWLRPLGSDLGWGDVNFFDNDFSDALGEALVPRDPSSRESLRRLVDVSIAAASPDAALGGNLPKRWEVRDGGRFMIKSGNQANMFQEPLNELAASALCAELLPPGEFVPYDAEPCSWPEFVSVCPCMVDAGTELVSAYDVMRSHPAANDLSPYEHFVRICEGHGIKNARERIAKMLVVDHVIANFDRHWGNFGVILDSESREWIGIAPLYDNGESLFCDQFQSNVFRPSHSRLSGMPFSRRINDQLARYGEQYGWLDPAALRSFADDASTILARSSFVRSMPGRIDAVHEAVTRRVDEVLRVASGHVAGRCGQLQYTKEE